jgi:hypothetical protein
VLTTGRKKFWTGRKLTGLGAWRLNDNLCSKDALNDMQVQVRPDQPVLGLPLPSSSWHGLVVAGHSAGQNVADGLAGVSSFCANSRARDMKAIFITKCSKSVTTQPDKENTFTGEAQKTQRSVEEPLFFLAPLALRSLRPCGE